MPLVRDLHPQFGYLGSFHLFVRKFGLVLAFIGFGVMAGLSGGERCTGCELNRCEALIRPNDLGSRLEAMSRNGPNFEHSRLQTIQDNRKRVLRSTQRGLPNNRLKNPVYKTVKTGYLDHSFRAGTELVL